MPTRAPRPSLLSVHPPMLAQHLLDTASRRRRLRSHCRQQLPSTLQLPLHQPIPPTWEEQPTLMPLHQPKSPTQEQEQQLILVMQVRRPSQDLVLGLQGLINAILSTRATEDDLVAIQLSRAVAQARRKLSGKRLLRRTRLYSRRKLVPCAIHNRCSFRLQEKH